MITPSRDILRSRRACKNAVDVATRFCAKQLNEQLRVAARSPSVLYIDYFVPARLSNHAAFDVARVGGCLMDNIYRAGYTVERLVRDEDGNPFAAEHDIFLIRVWLPSTTTTTAPTAARRR